MGFKEDIKVSFKDAKEHVSSLESKIGRLEEVIKHQNDIIKLLSSKISELEPKKPKTESSEGSNGNISDDSTFFLSSTGKNGVNQSITQSINHISTPNFPENGQDKPYLQNKQIIRQDQAKHLSTTNQSPEHRDSSLYAFKDSMNRIFGRFSKQELKIF